MQVETGKGGLFLYLTKRTLSPNCNKEGHCVIIKGSTHQEAVITINTYALNFREHKYIAAAAAAKSHQSCPTLCDPMDGSPSGSPIPGILQARTLEWVAISFSNAWKLKVKVKSLSHI